MRVLAQVVVLSLLCAFIAAQSSTLAVFDAAISDFITNEAASDSLKSVCNKWFGSTFYPKPSGTCGTTQYPATNKLSPLMQQIINEKKIIFGANSVSNTPKRYQYQQVGTRNGFSYGTVIGYEAEIGQSIANRIATQYNVAGGIKSYFSVTSWYNNATDNILYNLNKQPYQFDAVISGVAISGTWDVYNNGSAVPRDSLVDFTCPYQDSIDSAVRGQKPLPANVTAINVPTDLNATGIVICVQAGTSLEQYTLRYFTAATALRSSDIKGDTEKQVCHAYISPIINALYDAQTSDGKLVYVGPFRPSAGPIGIAVRKESATSSAMKPIFNIAVLIVLAFVWLL